MWAVFAAPEADGVALLQDMLTFGRATQRDFTAAWVREMNLDRFDLD